MNKPTKPATDDPIGSTDRSTPTESAPRATSKSAPINGETAGNGPDRLDPKSEPTNDVSPGKNRFMIALLDKLGVNGKKSDDAKNDG